MKTIRFFACLCIIFLAVYGAFAQEVPSPIDPNQTLPPRTLGSQIFTMDLGVMIPLFTYSETTYNPNPNLSPGVSGALKWGAFLNSNLSLGIDLGGAVMVGPNSDLFGELLVGPRIGYFFRAGNFQIPISLTSGLSILSYKQDQIYVGFGLKPGFGVYFDATPEWSFGININYWWMPEAYFDPDVDPGLIQTRVGNFLEITLSALYNFQ